MLARLSLLSLLALGAVQAASNESALGSAALRGSRKLQAGPCAMFNGIPNNAGTVCCSTTCMDEDGEPQCGGPGCGSLEGGAAGCCIGAIVTADNTCGVDDTEAPCVLDLSTPAPMQAAGFTSGPTPGPSAMDIAGPPLATPMPSAVDIADPTPAPEPPPTADNESPTPETAPPLPPSDPEAGFTPGPTPGPTAVYIGAPPAP